MSQKSSVPQAVSFVSQVLKRDNERLPAHRLGLLIPPLHYSGQRYGKGRRWGTYTSGASSILYKFQSIREPPQYGTSPLPQ